MAVITLKTTLRRLKLFQLSHYQLNDFRFGDVSQFLNNVDVIYPALFCDINPTDIKILDKSTVFNLTLWVADLANVSGDTRENEIDVLSDITQICEDIVTMFLFYDYQDDWEITNVTPVEYLIPGNLDDAILSKFTISIAVDYIQTICGVPADNTIFNVPNESDMSLVINTPYLATGEEGSQYQFLPNKRVIMIVLGDKVIHIKLSEDDITPDEFTYNASTGMLGFGVDLQPSQFLQIINQTI